MEIKFEALRTILEGFLGKYGSLGFYGAVVRLYQIYPLAAPSLMFFNAPFGRFGTSLIGAASSLVVNGNIGWLIMEIVCPLTFLGSLTSSPLTQTTITPTTSSSLISVFSLASLSDRFDKLTSLPLPSMILSFCILTHYFHRSILSTLLNPSSRSPMHISVPIAAIVWNLINGYLLGGWIGGRHPNLLVAKDWQDLSNVGGSGIFLFGGKMRFVIGVSIWLLGFVGNIAHDEILYAIKRRKLNQQQQKNSNNSNEKNKSNQQNSNGTNDDPKSRYEVPHGLLYDFPFGGVSTPSYLCEWIEWAGFAIASSAAISYSTNPILDATTASIVTSVAGGESSITQTGKNVAKALFSKVVGSSSSSSSTSPPNPIEQLPTLPRLLRLDECASKWWGWVSTSPGLFLFAEIGVMLPRALSNQKWYKEKFRESMPEKRKAVLPGVL